MTDFDDRFAAARYILWVDCGREGWHSYPFRNEAELVNVLLTGGTWGRPFVVTGPVLKLAFSPPDAQEASDAADLGAGLEGIE